jgi:hypothetical protein
MALIWTSLSLGAVIGLAQAITIPQVPSWPSGQCTDKSLSIPSWVIRDYKSTGAGSASFTVENRASDTSASVDCSSSTCTVSGAELTAALSSEGAATVVELKETWTCDDNEYVLAPA